jgi:hypothetical protein
MQVEANAKDLPRPGVDFSLSQTDQWKPIRSNPNYVKFQYSRRFCTVATVQRNTKQQ